MSLETPPLSSITTFEFSKEHRDYPDKFLPIESTPLERKKFVRFTSTDKGAICSISQEPFKIGDLIAVCNKCHNAFLARNLFRSFASSKMIDCPMACENILKRDDIKLSPLERLRMFIDSKHDQITILNFQLTQRSEELDRITQNAESETMIHNSLSEKSESSKDEEEDPELEGLLLSFKQLNETRFDELKKIKEEEIRSLNEKIAEIKNDLKPLLIKERELVASKESKHLIESRDYLIKQTVIVSAFALLIFVSFKLLQKKLCSFSL